MAEPKNRSNKGGRPKSANPKRVLITLRTTEEWAEWLGRFAESLDLSMSDTLAQAVRAFADERGFKEAPPKR
jgi:hypothetical protein